MLFIAIGPFHITKVNRTSSYKGLSLSTNSSGFKFSHFQTAFPSSKRIKIFLSVRSLYKIFITQAGHHIACSSELTVLNLSALLWNSFSEVNTSCYWWCCRGMSIWIHTVLVLLWSSFLRLRVKLSGKEAVGEAAAVICVYKSLPVCLFLRWLIRGAELGVGLFPLGRNRAAPFTVRKLSLILEGKRKEKRHE